MVCPNGIQTVVNSQLIPGTIFFSVLIHIWCVDMYLQHQDCVYKSSFWTTERNELHSLSFVRTICACFNLFTGFVDIKKIIE